MQIKLKAKLSNALLCRSNKYMHIYNKTLKYNDKFKIHVLDFVSLKPNESNDNVCSSSGYPSLVTIIILMTKQRAFESLPIISHHFQKACKETIPAASSSPSESVDRFSTHSNLILCRLHWLK